MIKYNMYIKIVNSIFLASILILLLPQQLFASEITIRPFLIDETLEPRGLVTRSISLSSSYTARLAVIYPTVNEITLNSFGEIKEFTTPVMTDRTNTVTSWVEITRNRIEIPPGETVEVPLTLNIHPKAEPGEYHLFIGFVEAPNKPAAQAVAMAGEADGVIVKVTIADKRTDSMKIGGFFIDRFITGDNKEIGIEVSNTGDLSSAPSGEIIFYNSHGVEVTSKLVNEEGVIIPPGETVVLKSLVPIEDTLGRFKANISLQYGENQKASLYDSSFFYMMPLHLLLSIFGGILVVALFVAYLFKRSFSNDSENDSEDGDDVAMFLRDGVNSEPKDHDINLKNHE